MSKQITVKDQIKNTLTNMKGDFKSALPAHISVDKFLRVAQTAILTNDYMLTLDRASLYKSCIESAQQGLMPDGKEAAMVPFKGKAQFMPMVSGILKKVRNSGELSSITAQLIHKNDEFGYWVDTEGEHLEHRPNFLEDRGEMVGVYALAKTKDGAVYIEILNLNDIAAIQNSSSSKTGPWQGPFRSEMIKKSAIRRLSKRLPMSTDLELLVTKDDNMYEFKNDKDEPEEVHTEQPTSINDIIDAEVITNEEPKVI